MVSLGSLKDVYKGMPKYGPDIIENPEEVAIPDRWKFLKVQTKLIREEDYRRGELPVMTGARTIVELLEGMSDLDREAIYAALLDRSNHVIGLYEVGVGTATEFQTKPRELFKAAILTNATAIVIVHNHPSGRIEPSKNDERFAERVREVGEIMMIPVVDFIIIGPIDYFSFIDSRMWEPRH